MNILKLFNISKSEQEIINSFQKSIEYNYDYRNNPTEEKLDGIIQNMNNNITNMISICKNEKLINEYKLFLSEKIENKQLIYNRLIFFEEKFLTETKIVYKLCPTMIMENIQKLLKSFTIYLLINLVLILPLLYFFNIKIHVSFWITTVILFFIPTELVNIHFLISNIKLLLELHKEV
jgi:hypothetical protein